MFSFPFFTLTSWRWSDDGNYYLLVSSLISWWMLKLGDGDRFWFLLLFLTYSWLDDEIIYWLLSCFISSILTIVWWWEVLIVYVLNFFLHSHILTVVGWWGYLLVAFLLYFPHLDGGRMMGSFNCLCFHFLSSLSHLDGGRMMGIIICWFLLSYLDGCCSWVMEIGFCFWLLFLT